MWAKLLWLKWGEELSTLLAVLPASPFSLLKILWLHEIRFETTGLQGQDQLLSWYSSQAGSGPWGLSSTSSAMHTLCRVDKSLNTPYSALSHVLLPLPRRPSCTNAMLHPASSFPSFKMSSNVTLFVKSILTAGRACHPLLWFPCQWSHWSVIISVLCLPPASLCYKFLESQSYFSGAPKSSRTLSKRRFQSAEWTNNDSTVCVWL